MPLLAIDYDGVIVDSVLDSLFVSHNAYLDLMGSSNKKVFGGERFTFQNWPKIQKKYDQEIKCYRSLRPFIRGATDYGLIQKLLEEKRCLQNQQEFDCYRKTVRFESQKFRELFYQERKRLQEKSFEKWLKLEPVYQEVVRGINKFDQEGVKVVIATSNRREYIARVFHPSYYNIPIKEEDILDVSMGEDKSNQMKYITKYYEVKYDEIYFVDDQLAHLEQTRELGIHVFLAGWSYTTIQQKKKAAQEGIPVIEIAEDFYSTVRAYINRDNKEQESENIKEGK